MSPEQRAQHAELLRTLTTLDLIYKTTGSRTSKVRSLHQHYARTGHLSHSQRAVLCLWLVEQPCPNSTTS